MIRVTKLGDTCRNCGVGLTEQNAIIEGTYVRSQCRNCRQKAQYAMPSRSSAARRLKHVKGYGLSPDEYKQKLDRQLGGCAICKQPCATGRNLCVDHDHQTNEVRDLLCGRCNFVLGQVNDDEGLLFEMMAYLKRFGPPSQPVSVIITK